METSNRASDPWLYSFRDVFRPGLQVLDIACGTGDDTADLVSFGAQVTAFDRSAERVECAREQAPEADIRILDMVCGLPFADGSIDVVVASLCLHYFDLVTTKRIAGDISRILKPGGVLLARVNRVGDVNFDYGKGCELEPEFFEVAPGRRKRFFTEQSLRDLLNPFFDVMCIEPASTTRWGRVKQTLVVKAIRPA